MINLIFKDVSIDLCIDKITQLGVIDIDMANRIYRYIKEYFGGHKYSENDLEEYGGVYPIISRENSEIHRNSFKFIGINSFEDVDHILEYKKDSIVMEYLRNELEKDEIQNELLKLEILYNKYIVHIKNEFLNIPNVRVDEKLINSDFFAAKHISAYVNRALSTCDKIKIIIKILKKLSENNCEKYILYFNFVESYLSCVEWENIVNLLNNTPWVYAIISTRNSEYLNYIRLEKINFIKNKSNVQLPSIQIICDKVNQYIERNRMFKEQEIIEYLSRSVFDILEENKENNLYDYYITKAILAEPIVHEDMGCFEIGKTTRI